jgi:hypothetical protein
MTGDWMTMFHVTLNGVWDRQSGPRGDSKAFVSGMIMAMAKRPLDNGDIIQFRAMLSPEPFMGKSGYPLLLASGETADGTTHLVDRQHPHDLFMELSASYASAWATTAACSSMPACRASRPSDRRPSCTVCRSWTAPRRRSAITGWTPITSPSGWSPWAM